MTMIPNGLDGQPETPRRPDRPRLSREFGALAAGSAGPGAPFDVVIVGSGYGGSVAAEALAGRQTLADGLLRPLKVCLLERGREYLPGEFPGRFEDMPAHLRRADQASGKILGNPQGLFDVRMGPDVVALVASGVGGGSLINAGVLLEPRLADFDPDTPAHALVAALQDDGWYEKARKVLGGKIVDDGGGLVENTIVRHPCASQVEKTAALQSLDAFGFKAPMITVSMDGWANDAGVVLTQCNLCGDCLSGCNVGAKNSLDANLLDTAQRGGVEIYSGASVLSLKRSSDQQTEPVWILQVAHTDRSVQDREPAAVEVRARRVILAAGALGSTEILLRSRSEKTVWSPLLGAGFSCNGDNLAAIHRMREPTKACADEDVALDRRQVGPTITGSVTMASMKRTFQLQEFSVPGPLKRLFEELVTTARVLQDLPRCDGSDHGSEAASAIDPMAVDDDAIERTLVVGIIGHDEADGLLHLPYRKTSRGQVPQQGTIAIRWPEARNGTRLEAAHERVRSAVEALRPAPAGRIAASGTAAEGPTLIANPMWRLLPDSLEELVSQPRGPVLTVHPLGGCRIGSMPFAGANPDVAANVNLDRDVVADPPADALAGVVDEFGRVYDFASFTALQSLVVLDGSIIPGSLGVNPALTITATAMRAMEKLCQEWNYTLPPLPETLPRPVQWLRRKSPKSKVPEGAQDGSTRRGATEVQVVERLSGTVSMPRWSGDAVGSECIVELTLAYRPLPVGMLMNRLDRRMQVDSDDERSRLRIFDKPVWEKLTLKLEADDQRRRFAIFDARLSGRLMVLNREASTPWQRICRAGWAWFCNRGKRDMAQLLAARLQGSPPAGKRSGFWSSLMSLLRMASRAGEVRRLDYVLKVEEVLPVPEQEPRQGGTVISIKRGQTIRGFKRLTFGRRANPWQQLTRITLHALPGMVVAAEPPVLTLDGRFLAGQGFPLLKVTRQRNAASAQLDLLSFGLYMARLIASIHLWTFRKPDTPIDRGEPRRAPGPVDGLADPEVTELVVDRMRRSGAPVSIRLTRYHRRSDGTLLTGRPLVMIHGYSASGNTFTHPTLVKSAVAYFCGEGREVWVVDLRTSAALPTSVFPWAMEQVGLVDIPAALLHIRNRTRQQVDVLAHCIGCVMLSMALLTDAAEIADNEIELGSDVWLDDAQLGNLKAFNRPSHAGGPHPCIRKLILSQKGPVLRYTDDNIFRAFVLQSIRRWLLADDYQFRPSRNPRVAEQLMDRLLASLPYDRADYDLENPAWPLSQTPWTATRHRMDALYGRSFSAANMSPSTLAAIDDIFGPMNLDTVSQTIDFARVGAVTNRSGRGEFVTRRRLFERWGRIPTFALHGGKNGLVDILTQDLLREHLTAAGVPFSEPDRAAYARLGHQDVLMGIRAAEVFADIEGFLRAPPPATTGSLQAMRDVVTLPWSGPRLDLQDEPSCRVRIGCLSDPSQGRGTLWLLPTLRRQTRGNGFRYELVDAPACIESSCRGSSADWMFAQPDLDAMALEILALNVNGDAEPGAVLGWMALVVYESGETTAVPASQTREPFRVARDRRGPAAGETREASSTTQDTSVVAPPIAGRIREGLFSNVTTRWSKGNLKLYRRNPDLTSVHGAGDAASVCSNVRDWLPEQRPRDIDLAFVEHRAVESAESLASAPKPAASLYFALASCQYPGGLMDGNLSQTVLGSLARSIDSAESEVDMVVFAGDQIYADATAGLVDPVRRDELFERPNDMALRAIGMRAVLRRVPALMLLDDHELRDNWEPLPSGLAAVQRFRDEENRRVFRNGLRAWAKFQRMRPLADAALMPGAGDREFTARGFPFRFVDTRTGRSARGSTVPLAEQQILSAGQWAALEAWLSKYKDQIKFVVTPSILLPRRRTSAADPTGSTHSDAWDGFPASMNRLFNFMVEQQIGRTVFLSGDEHHSMVTEAEVFTRFSACAPVRIVSVHSSGSHAPYPFANGHPDDMANETSFDLPSVTVELKTRFAPRGDGFARLGVSNPASRPASLSVQWGKADGFIGEPESISL